MPNLFRRLFDVPAGSFRADLRRQVQYLKAENEVLRSKINGPVRVTPGERSRLVRLAKPLESTVRALLSIVSPQTFPRWTRDADSASPGGRPSGHQFSSLVSWRRARAARRFRSVSAYDLLRPR